MVKLEKLDKYFNKGKSNENHVLREISLELEDRGMVCILGESGSGKTTLLNTIGGLDTFRSGSVTVDDVVLEKYDGKKIEALRNQKFGYIFQNYYLLQDYTVSYNVRLALNVFDMTEEEKEERVDYVLEALGMSRYKKKRVSQLSGGQQQRVSIARALVKSPEIILADEPTGNLDEENTLKIMGILKSISKECLVILVSHEKAIARFFADRIIEIQDGEIKRDYLNDASGSYQKMDDANIYLKDMQEEKLQSDFLDVSLFRDRDAAETGKIQMDLAWKDGKLYIQSVDQTPLVLAGDEAGCVMLDQHRPQLEQSQAEEVSYDLPSLKTGKRTGLSSKEIWKLALENIRMMGKKHRFVVGILLATSVLLVVALADYMMQHAVDIRSAVTDDSHYVAVQLVASDSKKESEMDGQVQDFCEKYLTEDIDYSPVNAGPLNIRYDGFRQLKQVNSKIENYAVASYDKLKKDDLVCGRLPKNRKEVALDKWLLTNFQQSGDIVAALYQSENSILNVEMSTAISGLELTVVGVVDTGEPTVYVSENVMLGMNYGGYNIISDEELRELYPEEYGDLELAEDEILATTDIYESYESQKKWAHVEQFTGAAEKTLGIKCTITGAIPADTGAVYALSPENCDKVRLKYVEECRKFKVYTDDVSKTIAYFKKAGKDYSGYFTVEAENSYDAQLKEYKESKASGIHAGYLVTIAVAVLSLIVIYFTIKSNAMARSEELTVYRLIGISPQSILKAYMLEMVLITAYTCIPAVLITSGIIKFITSIPSLQIYLLFPWWLALLLIAALFVVNMVISILPVNAILRQPPAQLAAKS
jgi:ABC-type lipoprotein export system ATPase subunit